MSNTRCPVCGQPVDERSPRVEHGGKVIRLKCPYCVQAFLADPERYLSASQPPGCHGHGRGRGH